MQWYIISSTLNTYKQHARHADPLQEALYTDIKFCGAVAMMLCILTYTVIRRNHHCITRSYLFYTNVDRFACCAEGRGVLEASSQWQ